MNTLSNLYCIFIGLLCVSFLPGGDSIIINEINYNSDDPTFNPEDWVEFYNITSSSVNMHDWTFYDEADTHVYVFEEGIILEASDYVVLCKDTELFSSFFPNVSNYIGNMGFGLAGGGELLRLFDSDGALVDSVHYNDVDPWPTGADGDGPTLELINPHYNNALYSSWAASENYGTPGEPNSNYIDCSGELGGSVVVDQCGICGGDSDGDGVSDYADECGDCFGTNLTCTGCKDNTACNYDADATLDGGCEYAEMYYNCAGTCLSDEDTDGVCDELEIDGCTDELSCNFNPEASDDNDTCDGGPGNECGYCLGGVIVSNDVNDDGICDDDVLLGCTDDVACNYDQLANTNDGCEYPEDNYECDGSCTNDTDGDLVCNELEIEGCTEELSCNFNPEATDDNDTCDGGPIDQNYDCNDNCVVVSDCFGVCGGIATFDCAGVCNGDAEEDICGICNGNATDTNECELSTDSSIPNQFGINHIYPNPFNPIVNIDYSLSKSDIVNIRIYDLRGQIVDQLALGYQSVGNYQITWDADNYPTGVYFVRLVVRDYIATQKLMLMK